MTNTPLFLRRIRSFVRRDSRITDAQQEAFDTLWPRYGLEVSNGLIDYSSVFSRVAPNVLEIGFGSGHSLLAAARAYPQYNFIGIETHRPGLGILLLNMKTNPIDNLRLYYADAVEVLARCIPNNSLAMIQLFFPDPWRKRRHHKRRIIQPAFVKCLAEKLQSGGELHLATDWNDYAKHMMQVLSQESAYLNAAGSGNFSHRSCQRPVITKFEQRGQDAGHEIWELQFVKL
ncbi:MAG: tRNA (guanosine(46)-N7)-methyltransferase TrmB [Gammaproteobacteria bacterium]|nr:tRNA (guanosine(46)-N7)-methyltransferase TrmB [Gammaproteobacteria bacterium]